MNVKNRGYQYLSFALLICLAVISAKAQEAKYPPLVLAKWKPNTLHLAST